MAASITRIFVIVAVSAGVAAGYITTKGLPWVPDLEALEATEELHQTLRATAGISTEEFTSLVKQCMVVVIDARPVEAFEQGHLQIDCEPPVLNVPFETVHEQIDRLMPLMGCTIILYCTSETCDYAEDLYAELQQYGFMDMRIFFPGWDGIQAAGLSTGTGPDTWAGFDAMLEADVPDPNTLEDAEP